MIDYKERIITKRTETFTFDPIQKQKSAIIRFVLDLAEELNEDLSDEELNSIRKKLFRLVDELHLLIQESHG